MNVQPHSSAREKRGLRPLHPMSDNREDPSPSSEAPVVKGSPDVPMLLITSILVLSSWYCSAYTADAL